MTTQQLLCKSMQAYLIFSSPKIWQRQEAAKLFIQAMHEDTMQDQWVLDEEWVHHICTHGNDVGIHDLSLDLSQECDWCNDQFTVNGYLLLDNVKAICHQK
jgi:hypothetical protein